MDFIRQRRRWLQGIFLVVHDGRLPIRVRIGLGQISLSLSFNWDDSLPLFVGIALYSWITMPVTALNIFLTPMCPIPLHWTLKFLISYVGAVNMYLYMIGAVRSFPLVRYNFAQVVVRVLGTLATIPFVIVCEITAVLWGLFSEKGEFYIVDKDVGPAMTV